MGEGVGEGEDEAEDEGEGEDDDKGAHDEGEEGECEDLMNTKKNKEDSNEKKKKNTDRKTEATTTNNKKVKTTMKRNENEDEDENYSKEGGDEIDDIHNTQQYQRYEYHFFRARISSLTFLSLHPFPYFYYQTLHKHSLLERFFYIHLRPLLWRVLVTYVNIFNIVNMTHKTAL